MIGSFGKMIFEVSEQRVRNFKNLKRDVTARYATHEVINAKPRLEFLGVGLENASFAIELNQTLGIQVSNSIKEWEKLCQSAAVSKLVLGGEVIGSRWVILSVSTGYNIISNRGKILSATLDISLQEFH